MTQILKSLNPDNTCPFNRIYKNVKPQLLSGLKEIEGKSNYGGQKDEGKLKESEDMSKH